MSAEPVWFLDVDGVVNAFPAPKPHKSSAAEFDRAFVEARGSDGVHRPFEIWYRPAVVDFVNAMHRSRRVQVCWLTTWGPQAATALAPALGLDEFDCLDADDGTQPSSDDWWKIRAIRERVPIGGRFVFTDDSLRKGSRRALREAYGRDALLVTPMSSPGLTDAHMGSIREFVARAR